MTHAWSVMLATKHVYAFSQVVSVYAEPDIVELNYHAGTACRTVAQSVVTEHVGVRFYDPEIADAITAVFLISVCLDRGLNLATVKLIWIPKPHCSISSTFYQ